VKGIDIHGALKVHSLPQNAWTAFLASTIASLSGDEAYAEYSRTQSLNETTNVGMPQLKLIRI
jgi:hypothetical protein